MTSDGTHRQIGDWCRSELAEYHGFSARVDVGDAFLNSLLYGTLKSFADRTDPSGFCQTSYGEVGNVKLYGQTHYPRDTAEAARALADVGLVETAIRILGFTLGHIPKGQYYIPHVYNRDGSIKANTIQIDTPAHVAIALQRCVEIAGTTQRLGELFAGLCAMFDGAWTRHYHEDWRLLDAGNFNEQGFGGSSEPICDLFTNASMAAGHAAMAVLADRFGRRDLAAIFADRGNALVEGIETTLYDGDRRIYRVARHRLDGRYTDEVDWISLYSARWHRGQAGAWDRVFDILKETSVIAWDDMEVISCEPDRYRVLGKVFGHLLGYLGRTGRFALLDSHLEFVRRTVVKPSNIWPEWWYHKDPDSPDDYFKNDWSPRFRGMWLPYAQDPQADYTVDSGNCEQAAVFLVHSFEDLIGIRIGGAGVSVRPSLPFGLRDVTVSDLPAGPRSTISYRQRRSGRSLEFGFDVHGDQPVEVALAVPAEARNVSLLIDGRQSPLPAPVREHDVQRITLPIGPQQRSAQVAIRWDG